MTSFTLHTLPVSTNALYRGRRFLTRKGKDNKEAIGLEATLAWRPNKPLEGKICATARLFFKDGRMLDIENLKALWDSLSGIVYLDDKQIFELHLYKAIDRENPRVEISVTEII